MHWLVYFWIICAVAVSVHVIAMALASHMAGLKVRLVSIGVGPKLQIPIGKTASVALGPLPITGLVQFAYDEHGRSPKFSDLPPMRRLVISAAGIIALFAIAVIGLGAAAIDALLSFWPQFLEILIGLFSVAQKRFGEIAAIVAEAPFRIALPLVCAKLAAFNLAPFAGSNGMMMLEALIEALRGEPVNEEAKQTYYQLSMLVIFVLLGFWLVGLLAWGWNAL